MLLEEFAEVIQRKLIINHRLNWNPASRWYAQFDYSEVKDNGMLTSGYGNGSTPDEALRNCAKELAGKTLVFDAMLPTRKEFKVPDSIK